MCKVVAVLGSRYKEVEGKDYWQARWNAAKLFRTEMETKLSTKVVADMIKMVPLTAKYTEKELKEVLE